MCTHITWASWQTPHLKPQMKKRGKQPGEAHPAGPQTTLRSKTVNVWLTCYSQSVAFAMWMNHYCFSVWLTGNIQFPEFFTESDKQGSLLFQSARKYREISISPVLGPREDTRREHTTQEGEVHAVAKQCPSLGLWTCCPVWGQLQLP